MRIVVLDGYTLNPGDLDWQGIQAFGDITIYDRTPEEHIVERASGAEIILTNKTPLGAVTLSKLSRLRYIGVLATGYNIVDIQTAAELGITVTNIPAYGTSSVAQFVISLLLEVCHQVGMHDRAVKNGEWVESKDFCFTRSPLVELSGKTMGIVGYGRIGREVGKIASALGMNLCAATSGRSASAQDDHCRIVSLEELFRQSDVISLHCPLLPGTKGMINKETLSWMKRSAILINTSRGGLIVESDLANALNEGLIYGVALDVLSVEPPSADNPLLLAANCIITPHIAWATKEARARLMETAVSNLQAYLQGSPINVVR